MTTHQVKSKNTGLWRNLKLIVNSIGYLLKVKDKLGVHVVLTGHEGIQKIKMRTATL